MNRGGFDYSLSANHLYSVRPTASQKQYTMMECIYLRAGHRDLGSCGDERLQLSFARNQYTNVR